MIIYDLDSKPYIFHYVAIRDYTQIDNRFLSNTLKTLYFLVRTSVMTITYIDQGVSKTLNIVDKLVTD